MPQVKNNSEGRLYLSVAFGKLRQKTLSNGTKVTETTPGAVLRETESGQKSWAIEFDSVKGTIEGISLKSHEEYGESMELLIREPGDLCCLSFKLDGSSFQQIMNYLPNVDFHKVVEISTYSYVSKTGRQVHGLNLIQDKHANTKEVTFKNGNKINVVIPYYKDWENESWVYKNGYPSALGVDFTNKKQKTMYNLDLEEFLKNEISRLFTGKLTKDDVKDIKEQSDGNNAPEDDLPF
jgi:hypothetical protein